MYEYLIERAIRDKFPEAQDIRPRNHYTGESGHSWVQEVWYTRPKGSPKLIVAKVDAYDRVCEEWRKFNEFVKEPTSAAFIAPLGLFPTPNHAYQPDDKGVLLYQYAGDIAPHAAIVPFRQFCQENLESNFERVKEMIQRVFGFLSSGLYRHGEWQEQNTAYRNFYADLFDAEKRGRIRQYLEGFLGEGAAQIEQERLTFEGIDMLNPLFYLDKWLERCPRYLKLSVAHQDVNTSNLLIVAGFPCIIDWERLKPQTHAAVDFAQIECEFIHHALEPYMTREAYRRDGKFTYAEVASALHAVTRAGLGENIVEEYAALFPDDFVANSFRLLCEIRRLAGQVLQYAAIDPDYKYEDYMASLYFYALGTFRFEKEGPNGQRVPGLNPEQQAAALITSATALAYLEREEPPVEVSPWAKLMQISQRHIEKQLQVAGEKFDPEMYVPRKAVEEDFAQFVNAPSDEKGDTFLVVDIAGAGKTNLLCHLVQQYSNRTVVFLLFGHQGRSPETTLEKHLFSLFYDAASRGPLEGAGYSWFDCSWRRRLATGCKRISSRNLHSRSGHTRVHRQRYPRHGYVYRFRHRPKHCRRCNQQD